MGDPHKSLSVLISAFMAEEKPVIKRFPLLALKKSKFPSYFSLQNKK
jgi:hypothetical protein